MNNNFAKSSSWDASVKTFLCKEWKVKDSRLECCFQGAMHAGYRPFGLPHVFSFLECAFRID